MSRSAKQTQSRFGAELDEGPSSSSTLSWLDDETEDDDQVGRVIDDRYQLLSLIGRGGMGSVYKAEHLVIRRNVALKLLHPSLASVPEISRRFEREAFAIGRISHPNCVDVMDFGKLDDGSLYLVMEFLKGHSLGDELADRTTVEPGRAQARRRVVRAGRADRRSRRSTAPPPLRAVGRSAAARRRRSRRRHQPEADPGGRADR